MENNNGILIIFCEIFNMATVGFQLFFNLFFCKGFDIVYTQCVCAQMNLVCQ
ncbi:unknown [Phocaeicola coprophilus CAG:333]|nr:unknown [Phocaeicola coprophilus CAG:333]